MASGRHLWRQKPIGTIWENRIGGGWVGCKVTRERQAGLTHYISLSFCVIGTAGHGMQTTFNYPRTIHHPTVNSACHLRIVCKVRHSSGETWGNCMFQIHGFTVLHLAFGGRSLLALSSSRQRYANWRSLHVTPMIPLYVNQIEFGRFDYPSGFKWKMWQCLPSQEDKQVVAWNAKACKSNMPTTSSEEVRWVEMDRWIDMNCTLYILLNAFLRTILIDFGISVGVDRMYIGKICTDHHRS